MGGGGGEEELEVAGESAKYPVRLAARRDPHGGGKGGCGRGGGRIEDGNTEVVVVVVVGECEGYVAGMDYGFESGWIE